MEYKPFYLASVQMGMGSTLETGVWGKAIPSATDSCPESFFYLFCVCLPLAVFWAYMGNILIAFGEDPLISSEAGKYARRRTL